LDRAIGALERKNRHGAWRSWSRYIDYSTLSSGALMRSDDALDRGPLLYIHRDRGREPQAQRQRRGR
jgi:hypothetical protein